MKVYVTVTERGEILPYTCEESYNEAMGELLDLLVGPINWGLSVSTQEDRRERKKAEIEAGQTPYTIVPATLTLDQ